MLCVCVCIITLLLQVVARWWHKSDFARAWQGFTIVDGDVHPIDHSEEPGAGAEESIAYCTIARTEQVSRGCGNQRGKKGGGPAELRRRAGAPRRASYLPTLGHAKPSGSLNFAARRWRGA